MWSLSNDAGVLGGRRELRQHPLSARCAGAGPGQRGQVALVPGPRALRWLSSLRVRDGLKALPVALRRADSKAQHSGSARAPVSPPLI